MPDRRTHFDGDAEVRKYTDRPITLAGSDFRPAKRTGRMMKDLLKLGPPPPNTDSTDVEQQAKSMDWMFQQLRLSVVHAESGKNPDLDWLLDNVPVEVMYQVMEFLAEGDDQILPPGSTQVPPLAQPLPPATPQLPVVDVPPPPEEPDRPAVPSPGIEDMVTTRAPHPATAEPLPVTSTSGADEGGSTT